ncbi:MAG TPA: hypothetical protein VKH43_08630 [Thermoanaerobaculia bacterium]|nr:hypothetical protein [Thermoanaerobaculia bacterium]
MRVLRLISFAGALLLIAAAAAAQDKCLVKGSFGGKPVNLTNCAAAFYDGKSVTIWITENTVAGDELDIFRISSAPKNKDAQNQRRTMLSLAFCVGPTPSLAAIKEVSIDASHSSSPMLSQSWVLDYPQEKDVKFIKLAGTPKPGGRISGKVAGTKKEQDRVFTFDADFDVQLPQKPAGAGLSCP